MADDVQGRVTRFRVPSGVRDPEGADELDEPGYRDRAMPVAGSVLWTPVDGMGQGTPTVPIFIKQHVLGAMHEQGREAPGTCFGLLGGDLYRSPDSGAPYLVVESTVRLSGEAGQDAKAALSQGLVLPQDALRRTGVQLVGWYRAGESTALEPSRAELETHAALFRQPWQIVMTLATGAVPGGGVYRPSAGNESAPPRLPFYEIRDPSSHHTEGKDARVPWTNYRSDTATIVSAPVTAPRPRVAARSAPVLFLSDEVDSRRVARPVGAGMLRRLAQRRAVRVATYATGGLLAALGVLRLFFAAPTPLPPAAPIPASLSPQERLDRASDTLALAISAFDLRARLFTSRQMQCPELARGLVLVEERWAAYNAVRKAGGLGLDSARTTRDRALYADADAVERRFEASGCPRP